MRLSHRHVIRRGDDTGSVAVGALRVVTLLAAFVVTCMVAGVLAAGLVLPAAGTVGFLTRSGSDYYDQLDGDLEIPRVSETSRVLATDGSLIAVFYSENRTLASIANINPSMTDAIVAIEDSRFYEHGGVDTRGTTRAVVNNVMGGAQQGASTITQQYVKNVLLEQAVYSDDQEAQLAAVEDSGPAGYGRKLREARYAIALEEELTKDEILERYLNIANFGDGTYGVQAAARHYFNVNAADLSLAQSATLAGIVNLPGRYNPRTNPDDSRMRRDIVLGRMLEQEMITQAEHDEAVATPLTLDVQQPQLSCDAAGQLGYFCDYVLKKFVADPAYGETVEERTELLFRGGLTINTTIDPALQALAWDAVRSQVPDTSRAAAAMSVVEPGTGRILAMAQNRTFSREEGPQNTNVNYNTDQPFGGSTGFQPGSNFKPITLATWLDSGKALNARIEAPGRDSAPFTDFPSCVPLDRNDIYRYSNAGGEGSSNGGRMTVIEATFRSVNTAYVNMEKQLDLCDIRAMATNLGVHPASDPEGQIGVSPSMTLGVAEVAPLSMAAAYATFAADGVHCSPIAVDSITDRDGNELPVPDADCRQALTQDVARGISYTLQNVFGPGGTARGIDIGRPAAGKTGTTNDSLATWFSGYTPDLAASVVVADPGTDGTQISMNDIEVNGVTRQVYGATYAAPTWAAFMQPAHDALALAPRGFPEPAEDIQYGPRFPVPSVVGLSASQARDTLGAVGLRVSIASDRRSSSSVRSGAVVAQSPGPNAVRRAGDTVTLTLSSGRPAPPPPPEPEPPAQPAAPGGGEGAGPAPADGNGNRNANGNGNGNGGNEDGD